MAANMLHKDLLDSKSLGTFIIRHHHLSIHNQTDLLKDLYKLLNEY